MSTYEEVLQRLEKRAADDEDIRIILRKISDYESRMTDYERRIDRCNEYTEYCEIVISRLRNGA